ncbi:hypothetical protein LJC13_03270 [Peptostreptococcaceae bacterium OttesenSCG-928-C18]|nr:hypothetical protein [Peptostreptococcaceae bacterium OttesenSCG-928-C18]
MFVLIDERERFIVLFNEMDDVLNFIKKEERFVDTTSPRDFEPKGYVYNPHLDEDWEVSIRELFGMRVVFTDVGVEVEV